MIRFWRRLKFLFNFRKSIPFIKDFFLSNQVKLTTKLLSVFLLIGYIVFPFDVIPDFLMGWGIFDDVTVVSLILQQMIKVAPQSLKEKHNL